MIPKLEHMIIGFLPEGVKLSSAKLAERLLGLHIKLPTRQE
jgi:hypothetical protein